MFKSTSKWLLAVVAALLLSAAPASAASNPAMGSLRVNGAHVAYVALISSTKAIVPAHAVGGALSTYSIVFGSTDRTTSSCSTCVARTPTSIVRHANYNGTTYANDIAVITFSAITFNANIQPIAIASSSDAAPAVGATVLGLASYTPATGLIHDLNHTVNSVSSSAFITTPSVAEVAGFMAYNNKLHGVLNIYNSSTTKHTFTRVSAYYTWILAQ